MTGQIALIMISKIAGSEFETVVRLNLFSEVFVGFFMVLQSSCFVPNDILQGSQRKVFAA
jgi:hypothetical protein